MRFSFPISTKVKIYKGNIIIGISSLAAAGAGTTKNKAMSGTDIIVKPLHAP
jgi:hypothetical protein